MHQLDQASGFIKANMPLGNPDLTEQEAWDVALYLDSHERPQDPRWLGDVAATRNAFHDNVSTYGLQDAGGADGRYRRAAAQARPSAVAELEAHLEAGRIGPLPHMRQPKRSP